MKTLQKHFTTPEQSKRLLELGVPVRSTDCYYPIINAQIIDSIEVISDEKVFFDNYIYLKDFFPCWSVGRLIEIYDICASEYMDGIKIPRNHIILDKVLIEFLGVLQHGDMDFSKLEEWI